MTTRTHCISVFRIHFDQQKCLLIISQQYKWIHSESDKDIIQKWLWWRLNVEEIIQGLVILAFLS